VSAIATRASKLCTAYRELAGAAAAATAATAAKSDTVPAGADGLAERTEPVPEQQQQQLLSAHANLKGRLVTNVPLQTQELPRTELHTAITAAIGSNTGTSVLLRGPHGCGKFTALFYFDKGVADWCRQQAKPIPAMCAVWSWDIRDTPAGLYVEILQKLKSETSLKIEQVSKHTATAKQQLEALLFDTSSSSSNRVRMIVVVLTWLSRRDDHEVQQLLEWAHTAGCRLILLGTDTSDLAQTLPRPQHLVVFKKLTESDVLAILTVQAGAAVLEAAYALCAKYSNGDANRAREVCLLATQLALRDRNKSSVVTVSHMEQAVRVTKARASLL
jgi:Cdc6-like AAA superfamily ATPase